MATARRGGEHMTAYRSVSASVGSRLFAAFVCGCLGAFIGARCESLWQILGPDVSDRPGSEKTEVGILSTVPTGQRPRAVPTIPWGWVGAAVGVVLGLSAGRSWQLRGLAGILVNSSLVGLVLGVVIGVIVYPWLWAPPDLPDLYWPRWHAQGLRWGLPLGAGIGLLAGLVAWLLRRPDPDVED